MPLLSRIYVWSVVFDPLMTFVLVDRSISGVVISVSRLLQIVVLIGLGLRIAAVSMSQSSATRLAVPSMGNPLYRNFTIYFCLAILAGLIGSVSGSYDLPFSLDYNSEGNRLSRVVNGPSVRPLVEYFVTAYNFSYFVVLPTYLLRRHDDVGYFLSTFRAAFVVSGVVGFAGLGLSFIGIEVLPRTFADENFIGVGTRFHGFFGEPRNAFGALFLGLGIFHLGAYHKGVVLSKMWAIACITAALLTQSASGLVGMVCFVGLYGVYSLARMNVRSTLRLVGATSVTLVMILGAISNSARLGQYLEAAPMLWDSLENERTLPGHFYEQKDNVYPIYDFIMKFRNSEILPIVIGSGLGSSSAANNRLFVATLDVSNESLAGVMGVRNPHSQLIRTIYESGVVGLGVFILGFVWPVKHLTRHLHPREQHKFIILSLLVMGCCLGQRGTAIFIYLGAVAAVFRARRPPVARMPIL